MSGICAILKRRGDFPLQERIGDLLDGIAPFGPDGLGMQVDGPAALGCALMRILPEDVYDEQPRAANDNRLMIVADARIDNRSALLNELAIPTVEQSNLPDSELILRSYARWGEECVTHLLGDFAFIVWDAARQQFFCARDPMGQRVLFYHASSDFFAAASSVRALLRLPEVPARLNEEKVAEFLVLLETPGMTFYEGVSRLAPAHTLVVGSDQLRTRRYWAPDPERRITLKSDDEYVERVREIFAEAVRCRLRVRGDVGVMLSAGLDSSSVAAAAATQLRAQARSIYGFHSAPPLGYSGAPARNWIVDESSDVAALASMYPNLHLHVLRPEERTLLDGLDDYFGLVGSPLRNSISRYWFESLYEAAQSAGVRTMLWGQRGNATISHSGVHVLPEYARTGQWLKLLAEARSIAASGGWPLRTVIRYHLLQPMAPSWVWPIYRAIRREPPPKARLRPWQQMASAVHPALADELRLDERIRAVGLDDASFEKADGRTIRVRHLARAGDGADIWHAFRARYGIESRDPMADVRLIEYCLAIPEAQYRRGDQRRFLARRAMHGLLPDQILTRTTRGSQPADWPLQMAAIRSEIPREIARLRAHPFAPHCLDLDRMKALVDQWPDHFTVQHHSDYVLLLLRGFTMGRFIRWFDQQQWRTPVRGSHAAAPQRVLTVGPSA